MKKVFFFALFASITLIRIFADDNMTLKDSLTKTLNLQSADTSRLNSLYSLACLDQMSPSCIYYLKELLKEATKQKNQEYRCLAMYAQVVYYFNHQDEDSTRIWMQQLSEIALKYKFYDSYFLGKRAEITMNIVKRKIEYSINEAEDMYKLAKKLKNLQGMVSAKLCLMNAYLMTARYQEGEEAGFDAYRLLPPDASLEMRKGILQEVSLACTSTKSQTFLKYLQEFKTVLDKLSQEKYMSNANRSSYLLLETLYADYYLNTGMLEKARMHLKAMDRYFSPTSFIPYRGLYYHVYSNYYRQIKKYDRALAYSDTTISLLSEVSDNGGLNYRIARAGILADAGRIEEAIPLFQSLLAQKDTFYQDLSISQMNEIYQMRKIDNLLLEKEQHKEIIHYIGFVLIAMALLVLIPFAIHICFIRRRLKKEEKEIFRMNEIAEATNDAKSRFLIDMSYSVRIYLNNVLGFSEVMFIEAENMNESQWKEYSEIIQSSAGELICLVNNVLDLSRLEAGKTKWQLQEYDIILLCLDAINMARMQNEEKIKLDFQTEIEGQLVQVDISRFTQIILSTVTYPELCEEKRNISFSLERDQQKQVLVFCIVNSPLAEPGLQTQKVKILHDINRLTVEYFGGTYTIKSNAVEKPTVSFTYPYSPNKVI